MNRWMKVAAVLTFVSASASTGRAIVVEDAKVQFVRESINEATGGSRFRLTVGQNYASDNPTSVWFETYRGDGAGPWMMKAVEWNLDEGSQWYRASPGAAFSPSTEASFSGLLTRSVGQGPAISTPRGYPSNYTPFYLAFNTINGWDGGSGTEFPNRYVAGWVELYALDGVVGMSRNAISYNSNGIVVGTLTELPEPTAILLAAGGLGLAMRRSRVCR